MSWYAYLRRMGVELTLFFLSCSIVFYFVNGQESVVGAVNMGVVATIVYGGLTFVLRQRAIRKQNER